MYASGAGFYSHDGISDRHIVVVMCMEIEVYLREQGAHLLYIFEGHIRRQYAECIAQHDPLDRKDRDLAYKHFYIFKITLNAVTPVFEIDIDLHVAERSILDDSSDLSDMLLRGLSELRGQMVDRAFAEEIDHLATGILDPGEGVSAIDKGEYLDPIEISLAGCPLRDLLKCFKITVGNTCGCDLDAIDLHLVQKDLGYA